jgi:uncharacterized protein (DUF983 family)
MNVSPLPQAHTGPTQTGSDRPETAPPAGSFWKGLLRGIRRRCPQCGESQLFSRYVTVVPVCPHCRLDIDAPPYFTIFAVGHIVVPGMLLLEQNVHPPSWVHMVTWVPLTLLLTLALLPPIKGAVIGAQWALRMKS